MNREVPEVFLAGGDLLPRGHTRRCLSAVESRAQLEEEEDEEENEKEREKFFILKTSRKKLFFLMLLSPLPYGKE